MASDVEQFEIQYYRPETDEWSNALPGKRFESREEAEHALQNGKLGLDSLRVDTRVVSTGPMRAMHATGAPAPFAFRHFPAGPERDTAREFYELWEDLSWLKEGPEKSRFMVKLVDARESAMQIARSMVRSESPETSG